MSFDCEPQNTFSDRYCPIHDIKYPPKGNKYVRNRTYAEKTGLALKTEAA